MWSKMEKTCVDNAQKKYSLRGFLGFTKHIALADDSGLEVDFLDGMPGVDTSARFAGPNFAVFADNNKKLLSLMKRRPHGTPPGQVSDA